MARPKVVHIKSNTLNKKPTTGQIDYGEIAVNYNSGNTFLAVKDSKNDIKVFTDKTTNDASYAPKSDFNELKQDVINNEQTTSAELNDVKGNITTINRKMVTGAIMSPTATTPSVDNNVLTIPTVAGKPGTNAGFGTPTASIDSNTGIPAVTVTASGPDTAKVFDFEFKNLKGKDGTNGSDGRDGTSASITGATATATTLDAGNDATVRVEKTGTEFSRGFNFTFGIPKGEKGDTGAQGPEGPSANATTNNHKRYLMGLSSTTGNITGATTSGSCYMSGGSLYSQNKEVLTAVTESNHYRPSTHNSYLHGNSRGENVRTPLTDISVDDKGHIVRGYRTLEDVAFLSDLSNYVTSTELTNIGYATQDELSSSLTGYVPTVRTVNGKTLSQDITINSVASATTAKSATTASSASSVAWRNVKNAPSFASSDHTHSEYVKKTGDTMSGTLYINNDKLSIDNYGGEALTIIGQSVFDGDTTVNGKVSASSGFFQTSDRRLKNFQGDIEVDFDKLKSIPKKYFYWNMDSKKSKLEIGTSAQEVMEVYPELVSINEAGMLSVAYDKLSVIALKSVDELHEENVALKEKNDELERRLKAIEEKLGI